MAILISRILIVIAAVCYITFPTVLGQSLQDLITREWNIQFKSTLPINQRVNVNQYTGAATDPRFDVRLSELIASNVLQLAHDIGETVLKNSNEKSEVFSPISIYGALSLLLLGANENTHQELMQLLRVNEDPFLINNSWKFHEEFGLLIEDIVKDYLNPNHPRPQSNWKLDRSSRPNEPFSSRTPSEYDADDHKISVANGIFIQRGFPIRPDYRTAVINVYNSHIKTLDFLQNTNHAMKTINDWVSYKTQGKIQDIVSNSLSPDTKIVIASALYFKAMWEKTFMDGATGFKNFYPDGLNGPPITVEMMANGGTFPYYDAKEYDCRILALPYKRNLTTMYIILPNDSDRYRLRQLQSTLTAAKIEDMISKMEWKTAIILFPKMHISNKINLKSVLRKLGVNSLFDQRRSNLALISDANEHFASHTTDNRRINAPNDVTQNAFPKLSTFPTFTASYPAQSPVHNRFPAILPEKDNDDEPFIFSRINVDSEDQKVENQTMKIARIKRDVSYKVSSSIRRKEEPLRLKDFIISKRITKSNPSKKLLRSKRQADPSACLKNLDRIRNSLNQSPGLNPGLFAEEIVHKIDLTINEKGTEGGAATVTYLYRTGTDVIFRVETPFMFLIRHDDTKLPLFYGTVMEPTNDE